MPQFGWRSAWKAVVAAKQQPTAADEQCSAFQTYVCVRFYMQSTWRCKKELKEIDCILIALNTQECWPGVTEKQSVSHTGLNTATV